MTFTSPGFEPIHWGGSNVTAVSAPGAISVCSAPKRISSNRCIRIQFECLKAAGWKGFCLCTYPSDIGLQTERSRTHGLAAAIVAEPHCHETFQPEQRQQHHQQRSGPVIAFL